MDLVAYARAVLDAGHPADFDAAVHELLARPDRAALMDPFIAAAHQRMPHTRMLYIDATVLAVLARADDTRECIAALDRAIVIAGAATDETRRDHIVHDIIGRLQATLPWRPPSSARLTPHRAPVLLPSRNSVRTLAALPSIIAAQHCCLAPFLVHAHAGHWPATRRWPSLEYLFSVAGPGRIVPVEIGDDYRSDDWSQKLIPWEEFLSSLDPSSHHPQTVYLAQHSLFTQFPRLRDDIVLPDIVYACLDSPEFPDYKPPPDVVLNAWLGPKGTVSPAHTDPFFNCYVQVVGRKTVWLAPPRVAPAMYPCQPSPSGTDKTNSAAHTISPLSNTSQVDVFAATPQETETSQTSFPLFWSAVPDEASCVTLDPGDLLFFPPGWWHAMRSEDVSFSVSMWF